jgi:segregation and condensation protein A
MDNDTIDEKLKIDKFSHKEATQQSKVGQEQIHGLLFGEKLGWQAIIYDLINTEQLDPWDVDLSLLSLKYLEKVRELEEADFFVSSKVLLAASLLLRIKSEILLDRDLQTLDDILFGRDKKKKYVQERIELDEDVPELIPRTPLPRSRRVTLHELMQALGKAIKTENRRIKKVVVLKQQEIETALSLPRRRINLKDQVRGIYSKLEGIFKNRDERVAFSDISGKSKEEMVEAFMPLLHLDNNHKIFLEQDGHLEEIYIWLKNIYEKKNKALLEVWEKEVEKAAMEEKMEVEIDDLENLSKKS